ncbi:MAG TPA: N,N'-diacetylchitobiose phosphorylase [Lentisphaeria bacterium]|nr:MAG: N,N'-diacetylchitobiose phosphorylase [Lentisphaerae bacterium GWF2_50_93]HCE44465.1 N,N'-diacetylchitobiose phosphorylase [Lentisphaeria bacterium]
MQYGYFDDACREYVITRPDTPRPWSNYLGSADFGAVITNNAIGYTFYKSAAQGRLTRFRFNSLNTGNPGKFIYLRDMEDGDYWTNSWLPVKKGMDKFKYECRFGSGYSTISSLYSGIGCSTTYFIPLNQLYEVWQVTVQNKTSLKRNIRVFPFVEPQCNWNAIDDATNLQYVQYISKTRIVDGIVDIASNVNMPEDPINFQNKDQQRHTFFAVSGASVNGFDADLEGFIGAYGSYSAPSAVVNGTCSGSLATGDNPCAAFQIELELPPGGSKSFRVLFGVGSASREGVVARIKMNSNKKAMSALRAVKQHWHSRLNSLRTETPDPSFNSMINMWAPYNNLMTFYWARTASQVYAGERDGLGFRDTVQDIVGTAALVTEEASSRLELMLTGQLSNGGAIPIVKPFAHRPGTEKEPEYYRSDDCLWFFNAIPEFVKETGDFSFYKKILSYADKGEDTVFGHLKSAIMFNLKRSGKHGLPCGLHADWNDCLRFGEKGESAFVAFQLRLALKEYIDIAERLGEKKELSWARRKLSALDINIEKYCWDGEWYLRGYRYDGFKFGSRSCVEGKIFVNPQSWAVLSGHSIGKRGRKIMDSVDKHLYSDYGIMLCSPPYVKTDPKIALARLMNPGMKENCGIFNHVQGWAVMSEAELGRNERAWKYMKAVMPSSFNDNAEVRQVEPYAVCQSTHSRYSPRFGSGRISWLSGSAVWNYYAMTHSILGIRPHYDGLEIKPCIPKAWKGFKSVRIYRDREFRISVKNSNSGRGRLHLKLNGSAIAGNLIPSEKFAEINEVEVIIGME